METVLCLAPMRGLTDYIYRNTFIRHFKGIDIAVAPFVTTFSARRVKPSHLKDVWPENNTDLVLIPQILSNSSPDFIALARTLFDMGYPTVNWNLGCPFPKVAKKMRGSGLLPYPDKIDAFLDKVITAIPGRLSIKTRIGRNSSGELEALIQVFNAYPLSELIVHPRTGIQMYDGVVDLNAFEYCLENANHRLVYNGDINDRISFERLQQRYPSVRAWMIGRGILADPFLAEEIKNKRLDHRDKLWRFKAFHDDLYQNYAQVLCGPGHLVDRMKGFWRYFSTSFDDGHAVLKKVRKINRVDHYTDFIESFFEQSAVWIA